ncbi:MAG: GHMP kinase, partial [Sinomicrobium sp.]|nr:GHMP kinase [Sinomicrobium sp.]
MTEGATTYYSNGKLLLTGEYVVLDGALCLALPAAYGQYMSVTGTATGKMVWESLDEKGNVWFRAVFDLGALRESSLRPGLHGAAETTSDRGTSDMLMNILAAARRRNPDFPGAGGFRVTTRLGFPGNWGLGSSSTLINNIACWANVNAYELLWESFSGSGYDIACAQYDRPLTYRLVRKQPVVTPV